MRKPSKKTLLVQAALVAGAIVAGLIMLPVIFPDGNELATYSNYIKLEEQNQQKQLLVEEVEAILGRADKITAYQYQGWMRERCCFVGQRGRNNRRQRVTVSFANGRMLYANYECEYHPPLLRRITDKLETWFRRLRQ